MITNAAGIAADGGDHRLGRCGGVNGDGIGVGRGAGVARCVGGTGGDLIGAAVGKCGAGVVKAPVTAAVGGGSAFGDAVDKYLDRAVGLGSAAEDQGGVVGQVITNAAGIAADGGDHRLGRCGGVNDQLTGGYVVGRVPGGIMDRCNNIIGTVGKVICIRYGKGPVGTGAHQNPVSFSIGLCADRDRQIFSGSNTGRTGYGRGRVTGNGLGIHCRGCRWCPVNHQFIGRYVAGGIACCIGNGGGNRIGPLRQFMLGRYGQTPGVVAAIITQVAITLCIGDAVDGNLQGFAGCQGSATGQRGGRIAG